LGRDEILDEADLPMRLMAHTSCFRREAGSAGRDTRGLLRVHEFDKVEILAYTTPEQAQAMHDEILARAEGLIAELGLAYRILDLCAGDIGNSAARTWDIEVYSPGVDQWLEVSRPWRTPGPSQHPPPAGGRRAQVVNMLNGWHSPCRVCRINETCRPTGPSSDVLAPYRGARLSSGPVRLRPAVTRSPAHLSIALRALRRTASSRPTSTLTYRRADRSLSSSRRVVRTRRNDCRHC
jgi:seryl-tRNA synthetase